MKHILTILAACTAMCLASCNKSDIQDEIQDVSNFQVNISVSNPTGEQTRSMLKSGWGLGDQLNIWYDYNYQTTPDLVLTYDGTGWSVMSQRLGAVPQASGYLRALYEENNNLSVYSTSGTDYYAVKSYFFEFEKITSDEKTIYKTQMNVSSKVIPYTFSDNVLTANINSWYLNNNTEVFVSGLESGDWAMRATYYSSLEGVKPFLLVGQNISVSGLQYEEKPIQISNGYAIAANYVFNKNVDGGRLFLFARNSVSNKDVTFHLYNINTKVEYTYTATGKTVNAYVANGKLIRINLTDDQFGITPSKIP